MLTVEGKQVISFLPENTRMGALVDLAVLQRIARYLPNVDIYTLKDRFISKVHDCQSLEDLITLMEDETAFHKTVNQINVVNLEETEELIEFNTRMEE